MPFRNHLLAQKVPSKNVDRAKRRRKSMTAYGKEFFDKCLVALVSELEIIEEEYPDWPNDVVLAAEIVLEKAEEFRKALDAFCQEGENSGNRLEKDAVQTGASVLRFLLTMSMSYGNSAEKIYERDHPGKISVRRGCDEKVGARSSPNWVLGGR